MKSALDIARDNATFAIPLPPRPGTSWQMDGTANRCVNCERPYNDRGGSEAEAIATRLHETRRHLLCPASHEAWAEHNAARLRADDAAFIDFYDRELAKLGPERSKKAPAELTARYYARGS